MEHMNQTPDSQLLTPDSPSRIDGRAPTDLRPISLEPCYLEVHPASCMAKFGRTWVLCTASVDERVPPFVEARGGGWVTGEYGMMPGSVAERIAPARNSGGRAEEISRLIGRSLRAAVELAGLGRRTITVDCQVVQADGGTRTAAVTGGYVALALALRDLSMSGLLQSGGPARQVAAVSVGLVDGQPLLDLAHEEDARAEADLNVVMSDGGAFVEVQGTAEAQPFTRADLDAMLDLAQRGIVDLLLAQRSVLSA